MVTDKRKKEIITLHTDPVWGSAYWQDFFKKHKLSPDAVLENPYQIPCMDTAVLRSRPVDYFIPRKIVHEQTRLITGETSGFSGKPIVTVFSEQEFHDGFVAPFLTACSRTNFPVRSRWLWIGPSGPHIIGKAVREILGSVNGMDPFSIDFDPRWYRKMVEGSFGRDRYFNHLEEQIFDVIDVQNIDVLFTTPPILSMLCEKMPSEKRVLITGVHYGGIAISGCEYQCFHESFPNAVHLSGYGNSLAGVFIEESYDDEGIVYATDSDRVAIDIVSCREGNIVPCQDGEEGQVMISRFDESFMILNMLERDCAVKMQGGIKNPHPASVARKEKVLY